MNGIPQLIVLVILYTNIWFVLVALSHKRRKLGKAIYWHLILTAMALEIGVVWLVLYVSEVFAIQAIGIFAAPIIAATVAGFFYWKLAIYRDISADNH